MQNPVPDRVIERVLNAFVREGECLISTYSTGSHGYSNVGWRQTGVPFSDLCHRIVWYAVHGPIPSDKTVDHTCNRQQCIRVAHLRLLSNPDNARRTGGRDCPLGECLNGHLLADTWYTPPGGKAYCRVCKSDSGATYRARKRERNGQGT